MAKAQLAKIIGKNIAARRKQFELSQEKLADKADVSQDFISRTENGNSATLNIARLEAVAEVLHCTVADFFVVSEDDAKRKNKPAGIAENNATNFLDIIRPLSPETQSVVLGTVAEMVRLLKDKH